MLLGISPQGGLIPVEVEKLLRLYPPDENRPAITGLCP
jgi:hypothetical protein